MAAELKLSAPLSGVLVPLDQVPDAVFAQRMVGDGVSIDPLSSELVAPCNARVVQVHSAHHALTLAAAGIEIVIHIGLDTVKLKGRGFTPKVKAGDDVRAGQPLIAFDADFVAQNARSLLTQMVVANMDAVVSMQAQRGKVVAGRDEVLLLQLRSTTGTGISTPEPTSHAESEPVIVGSATGLHARPAAVVASTARQFSADVRLVKDGHEANARSVVSIMALEVMRGDTVRVVARGEDAKRAVAAIAQVLIRDLDQGAAPAPAVALKPAAVTRAPGVLRGVPGAPGVAVGQIYQLRHEEPVVDERATDPNYERRALETAVASAHVQLEALQSRMTAEADADRAAIFGAHQELLEDPEVLNVAAQHIRDGASAAYAWRDAYSKQADRLNALGNPLLAARASDLRDVGRRVLQLLAGHEDSHSSVPDGCILVAEDLAPSEVASLDRARVRGFCTSMGSATSHVAILARALGIPAVAGIDPDALDIAAGTRVILDGDAGTLHTTPTSEEIEAIARRQADSAQRRSHDLESATQPAITRDGHRVKVVANIGAIAEAEDMTRLGGEGVGLLRTEFLFMDRRTAPNELEQAGVFEDLARVCGSERMLVIRTLDVGGDKPISYLPIGTEANPFLGERGIRVMLNRPELLRTQVRAVLRASRAGRVALMFPMISTLGEWRAVREVVTAEQRELDSAPIPVGIMVETPAAALLAERFAEDADFLSIGTNDLTQYTLAMDRTNPRLASQVDGLHPAVLRLIESTVRGARKHKRWVGVCGALASDPVAAPVLIGLGVDELSVSLPAIPAIKALIRSLSLDACRATADAALQLAEAKEVRALVAQRHGDAE